MKKYDYLIVGSGLFGATFAHLAHKQGKTCLVIDKRPHLGGNIYCENIEGINVHKYGAHIFHTSNKEVWNFVNSIVEFNRYTNSPVANYKGKLYNLPFNMNTFYQMWGAVSTFGVPNPAALLPQQPAARQERFGTKFNTAVNGFYKSLDDTFKSFTLTAENGLDQIRAQSIGGSTAKGE